MGTKRILVAVVVFGTLMFAPSLARALPDCYGYYDVSSHCTGSGGCNVPYFYSLCTIGCVHGECDPHGSSGQCCGHIYYSAVIYPDGGDCNGTECSLVRTHAPRSAGNEKRRIADPGKISIGEEVGSEGDPPLRPAPRLLFVLDRCEHAYHLFLQRDFTTLAGGM